jgi:hypothetical protein
MHKDIKDFIKRVRSKHPFHFVKTKVLECGSRDINGSPRDYFYLCKYTGIDLSEGNGVDIISRADEYACLNTFDVVVSTEMLEHDRYWHHSLTQMWYNLKSKGLMIITCAAPNRAEHGTKRTSPEDSPDTTDYYYNISIDDFSKVLSPNLFTEYYISYQRDNKDLLFYGIKI